MSALSPIYNLPIQYKQGGVITKASNTTLSVTSCLVRSSDDSFDINVGDYFGAASATTVNGAVNGLNGLDTGSLAASTVYAVYAIADQAGYNPAGFLLSTSLTAPLLPNGTFPSNYNVYSRIGWAITDSSTHFVLLRTSGSGRAVTYTYDVPPQVLSAGNATTQTAVSLAGVVPPVDGIPVQMAANFLPGTAGQSGVICYSGGTIGSATNIIIGQVASIHIEEQMNLPAALISGVPKVDYQVSNSAAALSLWVSSFTDLL